MDNGCHCSAGGNRLSNPILFNILSRMDTSKPSQSGLGYTSTPHRCNCEQRRTVCLRSPSEVCKKATAVLVKTVQFMKNLPAFNQMPANDQFSLLRSCWAPLFILGLAQERVDFEVTDSPADSMLKRILLNRQENPGGEKEQPTMAGVSKLRCCLKKFWSLDLSPKEYAYLKGTAIFNPGIPHFSTGPFLSSRDRLPSVTNSGVSTFNRCAGFKSRSVCWKLATGSPACPQGGGAAAAPGGQRTIRPNPPHGLHAAEHHAEPDLWTLLQACDRPGWPAGADGGHALLQIGHSAPLSDSLTSVNPKLTELLLFALKLRSLIICEKDFFFFFLMDCYYVWDFLCVLSDVNKCCL